MPIALLILFHADIASGAEVIVPDDYPTIQGALDATSGGDTVVVRPGVYVENIDFKGKAVVLTSEKGPELTVIDGNQTTSVVTFNSGESFDSLLVGFTITNGTGSLEPFGYLSGGGVYCENSSPTVRDNIFADNRASTGFGGGMFCFASSPRITGNVFANNQSAICGGGIYVRKSSPTIANNTLYGNVAGNTGGAITCSLRSHARIVNNTAEGNSAAKGGAMACSILSDPTVTNTIFRNNFAPRGLEIWLGTVTYPATLSINHSNVSGGQASVFLETGSAINWGTAMIDADPLYVDSAAGDFHLTWDSPCRNSGDNNAPGIPKKDFEGDLRTTQGTVDIGSDEFATHLYHAGAVLPGATIVVRIVGLPGMSVLLGEGTGIQDPPLNTPHGDLHLFLPLAAQYGLGSFPSIGVKEMLFPVPLTWNAGDAVPFQALAGPWGGPATELTNLMLLHVE
jgi:hypothetical protein